MNFFKKFLLYFCIIVGSVVAIVAIVLAVMYFAPGTQVLNYVYLNYNQNRQAEFTTETEIKITDFEAIEVNSKITPVYFKPCEKENTVSYLHKEGLSGFVRVETSKLYVSASVKEKSYSEEVAGKTYKTLILDVIEPEGVMVTENKPMLTVFIPANLKVLSANTEKGDIGFSTINNAATTVVEKFYANSSNGGNIQISNPKDTTNYYFYTTTGSVDFVAPEIVDASIKLTTDTGKMTFVNETKTPILKGNLEVYSFVENKGPTINFGCIYGNVKVISSYINLQTKQIGTKDAQSSLAITVDKSEMNLGKVYSRFTLASKKTKNQNKVVLDRLYYDKSTDDHILDVGSGDVTIGDVVGALGIDATSGNIAIKNAYNDVKVVTTTGAIYIGYNAEALLDGIIKDVDGNLTIDTETGDVVIDNLRGALNVKVSSVKSEGKMEVNILDIKKDSLISAGNRNVSIGIKYDVSIQGGGTGRLLLVNGSAEFGISAGSHSQIVSGDDDYIDQPKYNTQYRVGYAKSASDNVYTNTLYDGTYGKVVIDTTGKTTVNAREVK